MTCQGPLLSVLFAVLALSAVSVPSQAVAAELTFRMKDGSRLTGQIQEERISIKAAFGIVVIPVSDIVSYADGQTYLKDGSIVKGEIVDSALSIRMKYGVVSMAPNDIAAFDAGEMPDKATTKRATAAGPEPAAAEAKRRAEERQAKVARAPAKQASGGTAGTAGSQVTWRPPAKQGSMFECFMERIDGDASTSVDLTNDEVAKALLEEGREYLLTSVCPGKSPSYIEARIYSPSFKGGKDAAVSAQFERKKDGYELQLYRNQPADEARRLTERAKEQAERERRSAEEAKRKAEAAERLARERAEAERRLPELAAQAAKSEEVERSIGQHSCPNWL
jgi:hypothetical protein